MNYKKEVNDFEKALSIDNGQAKRLKGIIEQAYNQSWHVDGPNVDQINAFVAPHIQTQEEAFYVATIIISDVFGALQALKK
jgi:hypothetical protein